MIESICDIPYGDLVLLLHFLSINFLVFLSLHILFRALSYLFKCIFFKELLEPVGLVFTLFFLFYQFYVLQAFILY